MNENNEDIATTYNLDDDIIKIYNENKHLSLIEHKSNQLIFASYIIVLLGFIEASSEGRHVIHAIILCIFSLFSIFLHSKGRKIQTLLQLDHENTTKIRIVDLCIQLENMSKTKDRDFRTPMQRDLYEFNQVMNVLAIKSDLVHNLNKLKGD